jgi:hypothetical protein
LGCAPCFGDLFIRAIQDPYERHEENF